VVGCAGCAGSAAWGAGCEGGGGLRREQGVLSLTSAMMDVSFMHTAAHLLTHWSVGLKVCGAVSPGASWCTPG
jgi:hypothetical protein